METETESTPVPEWQAREWFDEMIDETVGPVRVLSFTLSPSRVLRETDPIAYRVAFHEYVDHCQRDGWFTVEGFES